MSIKADVVRKGTEGTTASLTDGGVLGVVSVVETLLALQPPPERVIEMAVNCLAAQFDGATPSPSTTGYKWVSCPEEIPPFKFVCCDTTVISVDDGQSAPVLVEVEIGTSAP